MPTGYVRGRQMKADSVSIVRFQGTGARKLSVWAMYSVKA